MAQNQSSAGSALTPVRSAIMLFVMLGGLTAMAAKSNSQFGIALMLAAWAWVVGPIALLGGLSLLYKLLNFRHGLLDPRNKVRTDVLGEVATTEKDPAFIERLVSFLSIDGVSTRFKANILKKAGVETDEAFGTFMLNGLASAYDAGESPLLRGDLKADAERRWPYSTDEYGELQGQFEMHIPIPDDMRPHLVDGNKLITGDDISLLTYRYITTPDLKRAYGASLNRVAETASIVPSIALMMGIGVGLPVFQMIAMQAGSYLAAFLAVLSGAALAAGVALWALTKLAVSAMHVRSVSAFAHHKVNSDESMRTIMSSLVRNKEATKSPTAGIVEYRNALRQALKDNNPRLQLGIGTGHALLHGVSSTIGYNENQPVCLTNGDMTMGGVLVVGGTGSGKTFSVILPIVSQIMRAPFERSEIAAAASAGKKMTVSMVTYDPKAVLHADATELAKDCGWESRNIGVDEGEYGMDLFDGLSAVIVSAILSEAVSQKSGGSESSDPFWGSMAAKIRYASAVIARVYELTDTGLAEVEKTGERIYSPVGIYKMAMACRTPDGYLFKVVETIIRNTRDKELKKYIAPLSGPELIAAIDFLRRDVLTLFSETTVGGFLANVSDSLADFVSESAIRERFGAARGNILDIDRLWDNRTVTNMKLSKFKYGDVATVITIFVKIRQYHWLAVRQENNPGLAKLCKQIIVIDEAQELVTRGGTFSEAQFLNMSRAMGASFLIATQTLSALINALGSEKSAMNMLAQLRTKIFLGTEDADTLKYLQAITEPTLQAHVYGERDHESWFTWRKEATGSISDVVEPEDTDVDQIQLMSHPLVHGRIEPLIRQGSDMLGLGYAKTDTEAYEAMYVHGEDFVKQYSPQGRISAFVGNIFQAPPSEKSENQDFHAAAVYTTLKNPVGYATVVVNRSSLVKTDKIILTHRLGFLQGENIKDNDTIDVNTIDVTAKDLSAAQKVAALRNKAAAEFVAA